MKTITPLELFGKLNSEKKPLIVDVRSSEEYISDHIEDSLNIEMDTLIEKSDEYKDKFKNEEVYFVCRSGARSSYVTQFFSELGIEAHNLDGGLLAWTSKDLPLIKV